VFHLPAFCNNICCSFAHEATEDYTKRETHLEELWIETEATSHGIIFSEFGRYVRCQRVVALIFFISVTAEKTEYNGALEVEEKKV
jgi:hypothetical protein